MFSGPETERAVLLLLTIPSLYIILVGIGRWLKRRRGVRLGFFYQLLSLSLAGWLPLWYFKYEPPFFRELGAVVLFLLAVFAVALVRRYLWELYFRDIRQVEVPKFLSQVIALVLVVGTGMAILKFVYNKPLTGLLIAPGIAAVIVGLAMQDLLGNVIAGFALHFGRPFKVGDWLILENRHAEVMEMNWRSTRLRTTDGIYLDIPNNQITRQTIVNFQYGSRLHAMRLRVHIDYGVPPNQVKAALMRAAAQAPGVASSPAPRVFLQEFRESAIDYEVKFWMEDQSRYSDIMDAIRTNIWYELKRERISIPFPTRNLQLSRRDPSSSPDPRTAAKPILRCQPIFQGLGDDHLETLIATSKVNRFGRGEKIVQQGAQGASMFVLLQGQARVGVERNGDMTQIAELQGGDCFGEMSLLTGEPRSATVIAESDCEVMEIDKPTLANVLQANPEFVQHLSELLARRRLETEGVLAETAQKQLTPAQQQEYTAGFLAKLRSFFEL
jgi:small-conductance mechanosensitive channel/CRP-like cAMP-binding protein